jgi:hypothetical protein
MKVKKRATLLKELTNKRDTIAQIGNEARRVPTGQLCLLLEYDIMTFQGLRDEFNFDDVSKRYYQNVVDDFRKEYCALNEMSESRFNETFQIDFDSRRDGVHIFKIMTDEDEQSAVKDVAERIAEAIEASTGAEVSHRAPMMIVKAMPEGAAPVMSKPISRMAFALEPISVYCRDIIPKHLIESLEFADKHLKLDSYYVAFITQEDSLSLWSPRMLVGKLGPHYFVDLGAWR